MAPLTARVPFSDHPGIDLKSLFVSKPRHTALDYFPGTTTFFTYRCRTAIRGICDVLRLSGSDEVLVPSYNCGAEIDVFFKTGASLVPYRVDTHARIDIDDFTAKVTERTRAALIVHYFGFPQKLSAILPLCRERNVSLIEDCAHALFSRDGEQKLGSTGDFAVFSFPKTLPVPDGGALVVNNRALYRSNWCLTPPKGSRIIMALLPIIKATFMDAAGRVRGLFSSTTRAQCCPTGRPTQECEDRRMCVPGIPRSYYYDDELSNKGMSFISKWLMTGCDERQTVVARRRNFEVLLSMFRESDLVTPLYDTLPEGVCPLYFPVLVSDRAAFIRQLHEKKIPAIACWKGYHEVFPWEKFGEACELKDNVAALPIHQGLPERTVEYIGRTVIDIAGVKS